ncbi:MAG: hypothetical protein PHH49_07260 [Candidatus Omnitrophica bacterium]|nr:hypothetical protein [Candidatus Omnitrophota bacterium]MDD5488732.1 hypothetical protein [Candidatus Omnitrophota bacterium]
MNKIMITMAIALLCYAGECAAQQAEEKDPTGLAIQIEDIPGAKIPSPEEAVSADNGYELEDPYQQVELKLHDIDLLVVGAPGSGEKSVKDKVSLGDPYKGIAYESEEEAEKDRENRGMGVPYKIQTAVQGEAEKKGY